MAECLLIGNGGVPDCGSYKWAGRGGHGTGNGMGQGVENGVEYYAFNDAPDGYYHNSGGDTWSPELRLEKSTVRTYLGISADKIAKGQTVAGISGTFYGNKKCISAFAARGFGMSSSDYYTYEEASFTMPSAGTVYYGGGNAGYYHTSKCQILVNGVVKDSRDTDKNGDWADGWRGSMFNKSLAVNRGDIVKVICEQSSGTHGMSCIQAVIVY